MNAVPHLAIDGQQLAAFLDATCRYAEAGTFLSARAFYDDKSEVYFTYGHRIGSNLPALVPALKDQAARCTRVVRPVVFCPPLATFNNADEATEDALANGLALSVECDRTPSAARAKLESLIGPATVVVASGGEWLDPETGEIQDKLHLHWRLSEPTRTVDEHRKLKRARTLAAALVGGDASNKPVVHPIRWPGSWHRKATPRLATILHLSDAELDLDDAIERLGEAVGAVPPGPDAKAGRASAASEDGGEARAMSDLVREVLTGGEYHAPLVSLAMRYLKAQMLDGQAVETLRGIMQAVPSAIRDLKDGAVQPGRWQSRYDDIPRAVSTARAKLGEPAAAGTERKPGAEQGLWPQPLDFLADADTAPPELHAGHVPAALFPFVTDTAERMGVDPVSVALGCIVACASVLSDTWRLQPQRADYTWTESPRLWGAIVGDPSILKSPVIAACTRPIDKLDADARRRHAEAMRLYKQRLKEAKADKSGGTPEPPHPRLDRYLIEGATVEAISEVLRDDDEAKQRTPAGKVLSRHDEMSEFFGNLDRYKAGGKGGGDRGAYLRLYNGGPYTVDRVMRGTFTVPNWSACFMGGIQPGPIQRIAKDAADDGLLQRFVYAVPGAQRLGLDRAPDSPAQKRYADLFPAMAVMQPPRDTGGEHSEVVTFHTDAHQHRESVDRMARAMAAMPDTTSRLKSAFGKWPGLFARVALTFHLIEIADANAVGDIGPYTLVVPAEVAERAAAFMLDIVLPHMLRADAVMFSTAQTGHAGWVAGFILAHRMERVTTRDVVQAYGALRSPEMRGVMAEVMAALVTVGWLEPEPPSNPVKPVSAWKVNPAVHVRFEAKGKQEHARRVEARANLAAHVDALRARRGSGGAG